MIDRKLIDLLLLVDNINKIEGLSGFFEFAGHVNMISIRITIDAKYTLEKYPKDEWDNIYTINYSAFCKKNEIQEIKKVLNDILLQRPIGGLE